MQNPRLAGRYAKSLIDIAIEKNQLEEVNKDIRYLEAVCNASKEFVTLLKSPVVPSAKKDKIIAAVTEGKIGNILSVFNKLLVSKHRENVLPEIVHAFIEQYNAIKGIHKIKLTTAIGVSEDVKQAIVSKIKRDTAIQHIELETKVREELIGGFVLEFDNNLVDASILRDLRDVKKQFDQNIYVQQIR